MKQRMSFRWGVALGLPLASWLLFSVGSGSLGAAAKRPVAVQALIYSTMPSTAAHRPEMAMDGDPTTYFQSAYGMDDGDDFLILLSQPIPVRSIHITTGDPEGQDLLTNGFVETSADGTHYSPAAKFNSEGVAAASLHDAPVEALRIRLDPGQDIPSLRIREITVSSPDQIAHIQWGPGRGFPDISQAPDLAGWAQKAETEMEEFWPDTEAILYSDKFIPPNMVNVVYRSGPGVPQIAATGGGVMTVNPAWCRQHPEDTALTVHETAHVIQAYSAYNPIWLVEGIADYIRWVKFEPEHFHPRINVQTATYHDAYQTTATFLAWCAMHYDSALVTKLSKAVRFGTYNNGLFKTYCGQDVDTLWAKFVAAYQADPENIITTPGAAADQPRALPPVVTGSSLPVDLSSAFNLTGLEKDGATFPVAGGMDGEGSAYSATLLGASLAWNNVQFRVGPANAPDVVSCQGQVLPLPSERHASLWLLGTGIQGSQSGQTFTVTYTDGTTQVLAQNLSDWFQPQDFPGESRAVKMAWRNTATGARDPRPFFVYSYGFPLDSAKTVQSLTLPRNGNVEILAVTLAD